MTEDEETPKTKKYTTVETMTIDEEKGELEPRVYLTIRIAQIPGEDDPGVTGMAYEVGARFAPKKVYIELVSKMNAANKKLAEMLAAGEQPELKDIMEFESLLMNPSDHEQEQLHEGIARKTKYDHMFG